MAGTKHVELLKLGVEAWNAWRDTHPNVTPDLRSVDLSGADLSDANLTATLLIGADLAGATLTGAALQTARLWATNLAGADLAGANLSNAHLFRCNLRGASLRGAVMKGTHGAEADLSGCDLSGTNLENAYLPDANLQDADLSNAHLRETNLSGANLRGAKFSRAELRRTDLSGADLSGVDLSSEFSQAKMDDRVNFDDACLQGAKLWEADLRWKSFRGADLREAYLGGAHLNGSNLSAADLRGAYLDTSRLDGADLRGAQLAGANLTGASLQETNLSGADLTGANLQGAQLIAATVDGADLSKSHVYGTSVWDLRGVPKGQTGLVITAATEASITVDDLEVAQFVHLLLRREKLRNVIDTITSKAVLILGRFTAERKTILDALAAELRKHNLLPIIFDFERSTSRHVTETIKTLAGLSFFVIADITNPKSSPLELQATIPDYQIPFVQIIERGETPFSMFKDLAHTYDWVLQPVLEYDSLEVLLQNFKVAVLDRVWEKHRELEKKKAQVLEVQSIEKFLNESR